MSQIKVKIPKAPTNDRARVNKEIKKLIKREKKAMEKAGIKFDENDKVIFPKPEDLKIKETQKTKGTEKQKDTKKESGTKKVPPTKNRAKASEKNVKAVIDGIKVYKGRIVCDRVAVRYGADRDAMLKRTEDKNTIIYIQHYSKDFVKVFNESDAYIMKRYIKVLDG